MKHKLKTCIGALAFIALPAMGQQYPYQNPKLTPEDRAEALTGSVTREEKAPLRKTPPPAFPRLGIRAADW